MHYCLTLVSAIWVWWMSCKFEERGQSHLNTTSDVPGSSGISPLWEMLEEQNIGLGRAWQQRGLYMAERPLLLACFHAPAGMQPDEGSCWHLILGWSCFTKSLFRKLTCQTTSQLGIPNHSEFRINFLRIFSFFGLTSKKHSSSCLCELRSQVIDSGGR